MQIAELSHEEKLPGCPTEAEQLTELIQKFRWMGLEDEAEIMCAQLARLSKHAVVLTEPCNTD